MPSKFIFKCSDANMQVVPWDMGTFKNLFFETFYLGVKIMQI